MTDLPRRRLAPMDAIEFSIAAAFRHFFFGIGLALSWLVLLSPLIVLAWYLAFRNGMPDLKALPPAAMAGLAALGLGVLLATFSIAVNWHRRVLLGETPRRLQWVRLDGVMWRYLFGFLLILLVLGLYAGAAFGITTFAAPALEPQLGPAAKPLGIAIAVLIGLSAMFSFYRLSSWHAALAVGDRDYTLKTAWRATKKNRMAYLGFTFWLLFTLAIAGAIGAGAFFAQQNLPQPWVKPAAFGVMALLAWLAMFLVTSVAAGHYAQFGKKSEG
ncbi:MAG: hypothetical protein IOC86_00175 [Aestuariivirga sp.]|nr:hypothetical protein [Aestuariivirga sp.]